MFSLPHTPSPVPISSPQHSPQTTTSFQARGQVCDVLCKTNQPTKKNPKQQQTNATQLAEAVTTTATATATAMTAT